MANTISRLYKSHESHFLKGLRNAKSLDENQLHKLRVDIKNIRVLIDLLRVLGSKKFRGRLMLKLLQPVFKAAGRIRTASLSLRQTQKYKSSILLRFREHLRQDQENANHDFLAAIRKFDAKKFRKLHRKALDEFKGYKEKEIRKGSEDYLRLLLAKIRADVFDINDDEALHDIRKRLKTIKNIGQILDEAVKENPMKEELESVRAIYDLIGEWHDTLELADALEAYVDDLEDPDALEASAPLVLKLKKKCLVSKRKIEKQLKQELVM